MLYRLASRRPLPRQQLASQWVRHVSSRNPGPPPRRRLAPVLAATIAVAGLSFAATVGAYSYFSTPQPEVRSGPETAEIVFERPRKRPAASKEENRDLVSSQHVQVKRSWEHPGVYAWGSNAGKVVAPDSDETVIKTPRRIPFFDGQLLRDIKLDRDFGVAVNERGDLLQWGTAYAKNVKAPVVTLKGKNLVKVAISRDRIIALSSGGSVYSIPVAAADQASGEKQPGSSWIPFWSESATVAYRPLKPKDLGWGEKVVDVKSGLEHCLLLTSSGRLFSAVSSTEFFPSKGQLGIPGLTWQSRPEGPFDQPHEVGSLRGTKIKDIAAGDFHSLALDKEGRVFSFGDNSFGQLGFASEPHSPYVDTPTLLPVKNLYAGTSMVPRVTSIAAGGLNSFFTVDATKVQSRTGGEIVPARDLGRVAAETWACGEGIKGSLGTGKWTHISSAPTKIKALSDLNEFDEKTNSVVPIRVARVSVGSLHACAVLDHVTHVASSGLTSDSDTNFGADTLWWGFNEFYQLGTGKRSNVNAPVHLAPLDGGAPDGETARLQITPRKTVRLGEGGSGRKVSIEQRVECGRNVTAIYSAV